MTISVSNNLFIRQRILARFSVDFGFILLCTSLEVDWLGFFRATSLEMQLLSGSLSFSNFIRLINGLMECKQCCLLFFYTQSNTTNIIFT